MSACVRPIRLAILITIRSAARCGRSPVTRAKSSGRSPGGWCSCVQSRTMRDAVRCGDVMRRVGRRSKRPMWVRTDADQLRHALMRESIFMATHRNLLWVWRDDWWGRPFRVVTWNRVPCVFAGNLTVETLRWSAEMLQRRQSSAGVPADAPLSMSDPQFMGNYPLLWDHLTQLTWEDGSQRAPSTFMVFPQDGLLKVLFRDVDSGLCCWLATRQLSTLFELLECALGDPATDWRLDRRPGTADSAKRVKRR